MRDPLRPDSALDALYAIETYGWASRELAQAALNLERNNPEHTLRYIANNSDDPFEVQIAKAWLEAGDRAG